MLDLESRLLSNRKITESGCWEWTGSFNGNGYGQLMEHYVSYATHRLSFHLFTGFDLNSSLNVLHKCDNPKCFNPEHLYAGTQANNLRDAYRRGRRNGNSRKPTTHCRKGHEYTEENTYIRPDSGTKACKECRRGCENRRSR